MSSASPDALVLAGWSLLLIGVLVLIVGVRHQEKAKADQRLRSAVANATGAAPNGQDPQAARPKRSAEEPKEAS